MQQPCMSAFWTIPGKRGITRTCPAIRNGFCRLLNHSGAIWLLAWNVFSAPKASLCGWYWLAGLCEQEEIDFILGHALYMKSIHGVKTRNDRIDSLKIVRLMRGGNFPVAYVYPPGKGYVVFSMAVGTAAWPIGSLSFENHWNAEPLYMFGAVKWTAKPCLKTACSTNHWKSVETGNTRRYFFSPGIVIATWHWRPYIC